jgi:methyl-accepting chemotaxis protein
MNVRLSFKLIGSFALVSIITLIVGIAGWRGTSSLSRDLDTISKVAMPPVEYLLEIKDALNITMRSYRALLIPGLSGEALKNNLGYFDKAKQQVKKYGDLFAAIPMGQEEETAWKRLLTSWESVTRENEVFVGLYYELEKTGVMNPVLLKENLARFKGDHYRLLYQVAHMLQTQDVFEAGEDHDQCALGKWITTFKSENGQLAGAVNRIADHHKQFHQSVKKIKALVKNGELDAARAVYTGLLAAQAEGTLGELDSIMKQADLAENIYQKMSEVGLVKARDPLMEAFNLTAQLVDLNKKSASEMSAQAAQRANRMKIVSIASMSAGCVLALFLGIALSLSITRPISRVVWGLSEGADQVSSASAQVAISSQQLAEGASEQAASIEETSSSLEEMSSMTKQNADNAQEADQVMANTKESISRSSQIMDKLTASMGEISKASEETSKIIKTIDEIAFQTNLLALNAAVEAARAGEAGAGFAVVADEVRNLAMRAAEAAKSTASLIEGTVKKVKDGSELVGKTEKEFREVGLYFTRSSELVGHISAASTEQAQGIEQINNAVSEMDKVVQSNAANAEESASAAEEMSAQANRMKGFFGELEKLIGGANGKAAGKAARAGAKKPETSLSNDFAGFEEMAAGHGRKGSGTAKTRPERLIPLEDRELSDF